jgi:general secretion pathway protein C
MNATVRARLAALSNSGVHGVLATVEYLARPAVLPMVRKGLAALLLLWILVSLWQGLWSFYPETGPLDDVEVLNPASEASVRVSGADVDIDALVAAQLFGEPGASISEEQLAAASGRAPAMSESEAAQALAGIEDGAPETRLPLVLRGVVASSSAGLGQAVIEHSKLQDLYQVGDELPVGGEVVLAKVLPAMVVLDNGGRYEVLRLFEESTLSRQLPARNAAVDSRPRTRRDDRAAAIQGVSEDASDSGAAQLQDRTQIAAAYRDRLYRDPESLADVVRVSAVRDSGALLGYRISPGRAGGEFTALGFETGDIVTGVNGLSLKDPSNTVRLYQTMRSAREANFELQRGGESVTLNVSIGGPDDGGGQ